MLIGVPKEIKNHEYRVGMTPGSVAEAIAHGHKVLVETNAGAGIMCSDEDYIAAGATIAATAADVFAAAEMIVKVKEPQAQERAMLRQDQILFTYLHLAPDPEQTRDLVNSGAVCIAYETVTDAAGRLPLLAPMSEVAGRMSIQAGAHCLEKAQGGRGMLLGGVPGVAPAKVVILGGGVVGVNAAYMATGLAADVTIIDRSADAMRAATARFGPAVKTVHSTRASVEEEVLAADLVIGGVLIPGAAAPKLVSREMISADEARFGRGGCRHRPGRLLRDLARHHPCRADLCGRRCGPLLRGQHAGRGGADLDLRTEQRDPALHPGARRQGLEGRAGRRPASARRPQRIQRQDHLRGSRRGAGLRLPRAGECRRCLIFA